MYADQAFSIVRKKWVFLIFCSRPLLNICHRRDATGFSRDVCAILSLLTLFILKHFLMPFWCLQADSQYHKMFLLAWVCVLCTSISTSLKLPMFPQESLRDCIINSINIDDTSPGVYFGTLMCVVIKYSWCLAGITLYLHHLPTAN